MYGERAPQSYHIASTDLGGLENSRQVRSNTYDDPRSDLTTSNGTTAPTNPTYETIQSAKNGMLIAGPPVLNPVYGPTGTPNTPTSPRPPPFKAAPNPVYAESGILLQQFPDVSALNPVYAPVGKQAQPPSDQTAQHYANPQTNGMCCVPGPAANFKEQGDDSAQYSTPAAPMYDELGVTKQSLNCVGVTSLVSDAMTKNESYGLLRMGAVEIPMLHNHENGENKQSK